MVSGISFGQVTNVAPQGQAVAPQVVYYATPQMQADTYVSSTKKKTNPLAKLVVTAAVVLGGSALATKTNTGDVLIGRNLDLTVSQLPCYVTHVEPVDGFKYKTLNFTYDQLFLEGDKYDDLRRKSGIDEIINNRTFVRRTKRPNNTAFRFL